MGIIDQISHWLGFANDEEEKELERQLEKEIESAPKVEKKEPPAATNIVDFNAATFNKENSSARPSKFVKSEIKTIKPEKFEDARIVSDYLRQKKAVIVNFEGTETHEAARIADFIFGTTYALDGKGKKIGNKVFIFAPDNVTIEAYEDEKKTKGTFFD